MIFRNLLQDDGDASRSLRAHDQSLLDVSRLGRTGNEGAEAVVVELNLLVGFMHRVDDLVFVEDDGELFGDEVNHLLLHVLRNPDAAVFSHAQFTFDDGQIGSVQILRFLYLVRIDGRDVYIR